MPQWTWNDRVFSLLPDVHGWTLQCATPEGGLLTVGSGLFPGVDADNAAAKAQALVRQTHPVGVHLVGPDVNRSLPITGVRIVGPAVAHPNFIRWTGDSVSFSTLG